jgi:hypothetical protein
VTDQLPPKPKLADPASTARVQATGHQERDKPVFEQRSDRPTDDTLFWEVEVTPLVGATATGRGFDSGLSKPRATFEVRALYYGTGLPEFGSQPGTRLVPQSWEEDEELALAIARKWAEILSSGRRPPYAELQSAAKEVADRA